MLEYHLESILHFIFRVLYRPLIIALFGLEREMLRGQRHGCRRHCHGLVVLRVASFGERERGSERETSGDVAVYRLFRLVCRLCTVQYCPVKVSDDSLIQFYWTPTWLFVESPGQIVQFFRLLVGRSKIIQRHSTGFSSWF